MHEIDELVRNVTTAGSMTNVSRSGTLAVARFQNTPIQMDLRFVPSLALPWASLAWSISDLSSTASPDSESCNSVGPDGHLYLSTCL